MPSTATDRLAGLSTSVAIKAPVKAVSSANHTLSGEQTVGGVACVTGDRVLLKDQSTASQNGIYVVSTAAWTRALDFDGNRDAVNGTLVVSTSGTAIYYRLTTANPITIGTTSLTFEAVSGSVTAGSVAAALWPQTTYEADASVVPSALSNRVVITPYRYEATGDGVANDTVPVQTAFDVAAAKVAEGYTAVVDGDGGLFLVGTLRLDTRNVTVRNMKLKAHSSIPANGAILLSLAGGSDAAVNQALLDGIYGASVQSVRTNVTGSLEQVVIDQVQFIGATNAVRGLWMTGFTRGCAITRCLFDGCDDHGIALNGSWSCFVGFNHVTGDGTNGTGIGIGQTGMGERSGAAACNGVVVFQNEVTAMSLGLVYNFGSGAVVIGNVLEFNANDGFRSQAVRAGVFLGNYLEANGADNAQFGGTNGTDFIEDWLIAGNRSKQDSTEHFRLQGMKNCTVGPNYFNGTVTRRYFIGAGIGQYITDCTIHLPDLTSTYVGNPDELNPGTNHVVLPKGLRIFNTQNGDYTFTRFDAGRITRKLAGGAGETYTVPANATVAFPVGTVLEFVNNGGGDLTLAVTTDTLVGSGTVATGTYVRLCKIDTTIWVRS
jgi:hypothetical protein